MDRQLFYQAESDAYLSGANLHSLIGIRIVPSNGQDGANADNCVGSTGHRYLDLTFVGSNPGVWLFHCHAA